MGIFEKVNGMSEVKQVFDIKGMDCADCARKVSDGVQKLPKVELSQVNFATGQLTVVGDVDAAEVTARVRDLGYDVMEPEEKSLTTAQPGNSNFLRFLWQRTETRLALSGAILVLPGLILGEILGFDWWWINVLSLAAMLAAGIPIVRSAWSNLRINHAIDINFLMSIATIGDRKSVV